SATDALRWAATLLSHRDPDRALALAERALRSEPFDDGLHELIVEIHTARGDRERARTYVAGLARRYRDELAIEPPASISRPRDRRPDRDRARPDLRDRRPVWSSRSVIPPLAPPRRGHRRHERGRMGKGDGRPRPRRSLRVRLSGGGAARGPPSPRVGARGHGPSCPRPRPHRQC